MLVTVNSVGFQSPNLEVATEVTSLVNHFQQANQINVIQKRSRAFQELIRTYEAPKGFHAELNSSIEAGGVSDSGANYRVDLSIKNLNISTIVPVELAFNNRESIGTNLLKLQAFSGHQSQVSTTPFGIIITPTESLLRFGGWDSSYGDNLEYIDLLSRAYAPAITLPIYVIELHGRF